MQSIFLVTFLIITQALASIISFPEQKLQKRDDSICPVSYTHLDVYKRQAFFIDARTKRSVVESF